MKPVNINDLCDRRTAHRDNLRLLSKHRSTWLNDDIARGAATIENLTRQIAQMDEAISAPHTECEPEQEPASDVQDIPPHNQPIISA
jgi:hypothetical protein